MNKKFLLLMLIGVVFAQTDKLDSLGNLPALLQPKLFFASTDNWIPPTLPNDASCLGVGCCLMPLAGCLIGREAIKKSKTPSDSIIPIVLPLFAIGISYSSGIAYRGVLDKLLASGEMNPFSIFYWNNQIYVNMFFPIISQNWYTKVAGGYAWAEIDKTGATDLPLDGYFWPGNNAWEFHSTSYGCHLGYLLNHYKSVNIGTGLEYYSWHGACVGWEVVYDTFKPLTATVFGKGLCGNFSIGLNRRFLKKIDLCVDFTCRYSIGKEEHYSWESESNPILYHFTGIYLETGIRYPFTNNKSRGAK